MMNDEERRAARRALAVLEGLSWIGTPYRHQASVKGQGADCLGLVRGVYRAVVGAERECPGPYPRRLPRGGEPLLAAAGRNLERIEGPEAGDVLLFRMRPGLPVSHCGLLLGGNRFLHAYEGQAVVSTAFSAFWKDRVAGAFAFPEAS